MSEEYWGDKKMNMKNVFKICSVCKQTFSTFENQSDDNVLCSNCKTDEALHIYLQALRRQDAHLSFFEKLILLIKG